MQPMPAKRSASPMHPRRPRDSSRGQPPGERKRPVSPGPRGRAPSNGLVHALVLSTDEGAIRGRERRAARSQVQRPPLDPRTLWRTRGRLPLKMPGLRARAERAPYGVPAETRPVHQQPLAHLGVEVVGGGVHVGEVQREAQLVPTPAHRGDKPTLPVGPQAGGQRVLLLRGAVPRPRARMRKGEAFPARCQPHAEPLTGGPQGQPGASAYGHHVHAPGE